MARRYVALYEEAVETIALGDSQNDFSMLEAADRAVLIPRYDGSYAPVTLEGLIRAPYPGPRGWNHALKEIFDVRP
jgi:mannosyl-3-phosphoglycerate phosphatase